MNEMETKPGRNLLIGASGATSVLNLHAWIAHFRSSLFPNIRVILTDTASQFVNPQIISSYTGNPSYTSEMNSPDFPAPHVSLPEWADLFLVLPASANIIGKAAHGIGDDLLSSAVIAARCPVAFVPSMNIQMWNKPAIQRNVRQLTEDGYHVFTGPIQEGYRVSTGQMEQSIGIDIAQIGIKAMRLLKQKRE